MAVSGSSRQKYLTEIRRKANFLLEETEADYLFHAMKEYTVHKSVDKLMRSLLICLNTPEKLDLLLDIRFLIPRSQVHLFDSLAPYSSMAHPNLPTVAYKNDPLRIRVHNDGSNYSQGINILDGEHRVERAALLPVKPFHEGNRHKQGPYKEPQPVNSIAMDNDTGKFPVQRNTGVFRVVAFTKNGLNGDSIGFTIKGGKESNSGIFVDFVKRGSPADDLGLEENDEIIEVNGISFDHIALSSAAKLLASLNKLKLVVRKGIHLPENFESGQFDPWNLSVSSSHSSGSNHGSNFVGSNDQSRIMKRSEDKSLEDEKDIDGVTSKERKVRIVMDFSSTKDIGFNLRGGSEYGLGLYVSSVDSGSLAEQSGLQVGDQILSANGLSFEKIKHRDAVNFLKSNKDLVLIVKCVGKIPEARCIFSEFSWLTPDGSRIVDSNRNTRLASTMPAGSLKHHHDVGVDSMDIPLNSTISDFRSSKESVGVQTPDLTIPVDALDIESRHEGRETPVPDVVSDLSPRNNELRYGPDLDKSDIGLRASPLMPEREPNVVMALAVRSPSPREDDGGNQACKEVLSNLDVILDEAPKGENEQSREHGFNEKESDMANGISTSSGASTSNVAPLTSTTAVTNFAAKAEEPVEKSKGMKKEQRSKSFLQKQGEKLKEKFSLRRKSKSVDRDLLNSNLFERPRSSQEVLEEIREKAQARLPEDDYSLLIKCIKHYLEKGDIELFSTQVIEIVDTPSKAELLKDIREIVFPYDVSRYDVRIAKREIEHLEELGFGAEPHIFEGAISDKPPRRTIVKAVQSKGGKFQLKSKEEAEQLEKEKELKARNPSKMYLQTKSILERDRTIRKYDSFHKIPQPSSEYAAPCDQLGNEKAPNKALTAEEIDAMYAKVDKSLKQNQENANGESNIYETFDDGGQSAATDTKDTPREQNLISRENHDSETDEDDGYSLPCVERPAVDNTKACPMPGMRRKIVISIPKTHSTLGISISGGSGSIAQPVVLIDKVFPGGAASAVVGLKAGQQIVSVDGEGLDNASHAEAVDVIRRAYNEKSRPLMEMEVYID